MPNNILIMHKKIFIFRGSPASGKGTITQELIKQIPGKIALLELDKFRWSFHLVNRAVPDVTYDEHTLAYNNLLSVLENYLKDGSYTIIVEGLFSWNTPGPHGNMQDILNLCAKQDYKPVPILLYADKEILWERNLNRKYSVPKIEFNELYDYVMNDTSDHELKIDVSINDVVSTIEILKNYI
jgi:predicted kinase